jgi:hypothetical protein
MLKVMDMVMFKIADMAIIIRKKVMEMEMEEVMAMEKAMVRNNQC